MQLLLLLLLLPPLLLLLLAATVSASVGACPARRLLEKRGQELPAGHEAEHRAALEHPLRPPGPPRPGGAVDRVETRRSDDAP